MSDSDKRSDREAKKAIMRIETQMRLDGKLDKADAAEGAAYLLFPIFLGAVGAVAYTLSVLGIEGKAVVFIGVPMLIALCLLGLRLFHRS